MKYSNSKDFLSREVRVLSSFILNCYPRVLDLCRCFDTVVSKFIQKGVFREDELRAWKGEISSEVLKDGLNLMKRDPKMPLYWSPTAEPSEGDRCSFIRKALYCDRSFAN